MLSKQELYVLSYYRACELAGALLFGKLAFHTTADRYRAQLTEHCLEEARHAWLWTETIQELGETPLKITRTYQAEYGKRFGTPENILEIFCLTQVFEKRTLSHFRKHLQLPDTHPLIKKTLQRMIDDESGHIGWIRLELNKYAQDHGPEPLQRMMSKLETMDEQVYTALITSSPFQDYFKDLL